MNSTRNTTNRAFLHPGFAFSKLLEIISLAHLITESNIKAYVQPVVLFAMLSVASGGVTSASDPPWTELGSAFVHVSLYIWLYVLHFDCSNQKDPESIEEDKINKPWRAIPSGRLTIDGAETWYIVATLLLVAASIWLGGFPEAAAFMMETWVYDRANGAGSWWAKNIINALFYSTGQLGGIQVAAKCIGSGSMSNAGYTWCALLGLNTLTTVQIQDLRDQEGDGARGRRTMPLVLGDGPSRLVTAAFISIWSVVCPLYWAGGYFTAGFLLPIVIGGWVVIRMMLKRSPKMDRFTFHVYTLFWQPSLYLVPLLSSLRWA